MKCPRCHKRNIKKANYCQNCGKKIPKKVKIEENKKQNPIVYFFEHLKTAYDIVTGNFIKSKPIFKILSVIIVLLVGIYMVIVNGWNLKVLQSEKYDVHYNEKVDTYYILLKNKEEKEVEAEFYVPNHIVSLDLTYYDENGNVIDTKENEQKDKYSLIVNSVSNNYYILKNHNDSKEKIKIYVYDGEQNEK